MRANSSTTALDESSRMNNRRVTMSILPSSNKRVFGEEIDINDENNGERRPVDDSSILKPGFHSKLMSEELEGDTTASVASDCMTEASSVADLRSWLDDFGKKNSDHFERNTSKPSSSLLSTPTRPKVRRSICEKPPTPLPPVAANALVRRMVKERHSEMRRLCEKGSPVEINRKVAKEKVEATNDGYASVSQLAKWLAEDPTSQKRTKQIRRGKNVIAKSLKFDKGLSQTIAESHNIRRNNTMQLSKAFDGKVEESANVNVANKKEWLRGVFQPDYSASDPFLAPPDDKEEPVMTAARAKEMWRARDTKEAAPSITSSAVSPPQNVEPVKFLDREQSSEGSGADSTFELKETLSSSDRRVKIRTAAADDETLDFKSARRLLIVRSERNGNPVNAPCRKALL